MGGRGCAGWSGAKRGNAGGKGCAGWRGIKGEKWDNCNNIINKIDLKKSQKSHV